MVFERVTALCRVLERGRLGFGNRAIGLGVHLSVWVYMQAYVRVFTHVAGRSFCQLHTCACLTMRISRHCTFLSNSHCCCSSSSPRTAANATATSTSTSTSTTTSTSTSPSTSATSIITTTSPPPPPPLAAAPEAAAAAATTQLLTIPPLRVTHPASAATVAAAVLTSVSIRRSTRSTHCHHQRRKVNSVHGASTVGASSWIATLFFAAIL